MPQRIQVASEVMDGDTIRVPIAVTVAKGTVPYKLDVFISWPNLNTTTQQSRDAD